MRIEKTHSSSRRGVSSAEILVAITLLAIAAAIVGRFMSQISHGLDQRELSSRIGWEVESARATVATWAYDEITAENIEKRLDISEAIGQELEVAAWQADVQDIQEPLLGRRIRLSLACVYSGQTANPVSLTFWVANPIQSGSLATEVQDDS